MVWLFEYWALTATLRFQRRKKVFSFRLSATDKERSEIQDQVVKYRRWSSERNEEGAYIERFHLLFTTNSRRWRLLLLRTWITDGIFSWTSNESKENQRIIQKRKSLDDEGLLHGTDCSRRRTCASPLAPNRLKTLPRRLMSQRVPQPISLARATSHTKTKTWKWSYFRRQGEKIIDKE